MTLEWIDGPHGVVIFCFKLLSGIGGGSDDQIVFDGLRERAVARVLAGESVRSVATVLSVSAATVVCWSGR